MKILPPPDQPDQQIHSIQWDIWLQWVLATTLGWILGWALGGEIGIGTVVGIAQWLVLRPLVSQAGWWILASTAGWVVAWALIVPGVLVSPADGIVASIVAGAVFGFMLGLAQWFVLRRLVFYAGWWVAASTVGWTISLVGILGGTVAGAVAGVVTGFALDLLLRHPLSEPH